jgi:hypothetical protein
VEKLFWVKVVIPTKICELVTAYYLQPVKINTCVETLFSSFLRADWSRQRHYQIRDAQIKRLSHGFNLNM